MFFCNFFFFCKTASHTSAQNNNDKIFMDAGGDRKNVKHALVFFRILQLVAVGHDRRLVNVARYPWHDDPLQFEIRLFGFQNDDQIAFGQCVQVGKRNGRL